MSKGKWFTTRENISCAVRLVTNGDPECTTRSKLVKAVMKAQRISYACANYAVNKAEANHPQLFRRFTNGKVAAPVISSR